MSDQQRAIAALQTLTDAPWRASTLEGDRTFILCERDALSPAQHSRLESLENLRALDIFTPQNDDPLFEASQSMVILNGVDADKLEQQAELEASRRRQGPHAAKLLGTLTGLEWEWDGYRPITVASFNAIQNPEATAMLQELRQAGAIDWGVDAREPEQTSDYVPGGEGYAYAREFDVSMLQEKAKAIPKRWTAPESLGPRTGMQPGGPN